MIFNMLALAGILLGAFLAYRAGKQGDDSAKLLYLLGAMAAFLCAIGFMGGGYSIRISPVMLALLLGTVGAVISSGASRVIFAVIAFVLFVSAVPLHF